MPFFTTSDFYRLALEGGLKGPYPEDVADVKWDVIAGPSGEDAIYLRIILKDSTPAERRKYGHLSPIADHFRAKAGNALATQTQFHLASRPPDVYTSFRLKSEDDAITRGGGR